MVETGLKHEPEGLAFPPCQGGLYSPCYFLPSRLLPACNTFPPATYSCRIVELRTSIFYYILCWIRYLLFTSLVVQWLRILLPVQGTRVQSLVWEDPTCHGATKPVRHNYWSPRAQVLVGRNYWARTPRALAPQQVKPPQREACAPATKSSPCSPQLEKARAQQQRPNAAKNK